MKRLALVLMVLAGCAAPPEPRVDESRLRALDADNQVRREEAFQDLLRGEGAPAAALRNALGAGAAHGFPVVALLYAQGRGDAVPLEIKIRHLVAFEWPADPAGENAVVEPYVRGALEQDLAKIGLPALPLLGWALEHLADDEAASVRLVRVMLRIGGRAAAREFARLLGSERAGDAASSALLYMGRQELPLRLASAKDRIAAAASWWELASDFPENEWIRDSVDALVKHFHPKDAEGVRPVLELLVGRTLEDPRAWAAEHGAWSPTPAPLRPEELLPTLSEGRAAAYDANRRLEEATGQRVYLPRIERLGELRAALGLWSPPADLELRWRRVLVSPLLRLSVAAIGLSPRPDGTRIRWAYESHFHPVEEETAELRIETQTERYSLFVQALDLGTRLSMSEAHGASGLWNGVVREFRESRPMLMFSTPFKAALVAVVEEVPQRRPPPTPAVAQAEWRARLAAMMDNPDALRALAYFQDPADLPLLRERKAGEALLLLGDPAALELRPKLRPYEIDPALRAAQDPRVRDYLGELRRDAR
jgi:hypothetical protein